MLNFFNCLERTTGYQIGFPTFEEIYYVSWLILMNHCHCVMSVSSIDNYSCYVTLLCSCSSEWYCSIWCHWACCTSLLSNWASFIHYSDVTLILRNVDNYLCSVLTLHSGISSLYNCMEFKLWISVWWTRHVTEEKRQVLVSVMWLIAYTVYSIFKLQLVLNTSRIRKCTVSYETCIDSWIVKSCCGMLYVLIYVVTLDADCQVAVLMFRQILTTAYK